MKPYAVWRRGRRLFSPLTRRILAINLLAPVLLAAGLLYVDQYREALIEAQVEALFAQGELMGGALGEAALSPQDSIPELGAEISRSIIRRLAATSGARVRLFSPDGGLVADSSVLFEAGRDVLLLPLDADRVPTWGERLRSLFDRVGDMMAARRNLPVYQEKPDQSAEDYPEVLEALEGEPASEISVTPGGRLVISAAVPVQGLRTVVGALLLSVDSSGLDARVRDERLTILRLFGLVLVVTVLVSLYLAGAIVRPIRRLALAAKAVRGGGNRRAEIPDFSHRYDEIGELSTALREMTEAMYRRLDAIESFAADVAHEIKNPLTSMRSAIETLERTKDPEKRERLLRIVVEDIRRVDRLISDISDASRLDAELSRAEVGRVDFARLLASLVEAYREILDLSPERLLLDAPDTPLFVAGDDGRLGQVVRNLLENARSFTPPDGAIRMVVQRDGGFVVLTVEDNGPGIPDDKVEAIFDRFYSERPESEAFGRHSGLGLSISRQIVTAYGGTIRAENVRDAAGQVTGARFTVRLPALT